MMSIASHTVAGYLGEESGKGQCAVQRILHTETENLSNPVYRSLLSLALPLPRRQPSKGLSRCLDITSFPSSLF